MISTQSLTIAYQDEHLVAIDKPAGLLVHRSRIAAEAREFAMQKLRDQIGQPVFPVHRLDRPTSGVLLFGLNPEMASISIIIFLTILQKKYSIATYLTDPV